MADTGSIQVINLTEIQNALISMFQGKDYSKLYKIIGNLMQDAVEENFATQGEYFGGTEWAPLKPATIRARERKGYWPGKILQVTGGLAASFSYTVTDEGLDTGFGKEYAPYLHFGTSRMVGRPILPDIIPEKTLQEISEQVIKFFINSLPKS
jgi:phage gpG-like protein